MFSFSKLTRRGGSEKKQKQRRRQAHANSPYDSYVLPSSSPAPYNHHHHDGSTVSLPTGIFGSRSNSSLHRDLYPPVTSSRPPTRLDNASGMSDTNDSARRLIAARARAHALLPRPSTFHELDPMLLHRLRGNNGQSTDLGPGVSPIALPQKALALLGLEERGAAFERPASPMILGGDADSICGQLDDGRTFCSRDSDLFSEYTQKTYMGDTRLSRQTFKFTQLGPQLGPPPDRVYFRPESLCSSFSTSSDHTEGTEITAMTMMTPTSIMQCESPEFDPQEDGTLTSESTIKGSVNGISMLNLDSDTDSDNEQAIPTRQRMRDFPSVPPSPCRSGELPLEIALQICSYFSQDAHTADLPLGSRDCPNCNLHVLHSLALTSRSWSDAATRTLYRVISLDLGSYDPTKKSMTPFSTCTHSGTDTPLHTKVDVEARLPLLYRTIWDSPDTLPQRIEGIKIPRGMFGITKYPLSAILQKCPNLRFIDGAALTGSGKDILSILEPLSEIEQWTWRKPLIRPASPRLPTGFLKPETPSSTVSSLSLHTRSPSTPLSTASNPSSFNTSIVPRLLTAWQRLHTLELDNVDIPFTITNPHPFPPSLRHLILRNLVSPESPQIYNYLPPLQSLTVDSSASTDELLQYLYRHGSTLRTLRVHNICITIEDVMPYIPRLRTLVATGMGVKMGLLGEDDGRELRQVEVDTEMGLKESIGWLVEASKRRGVARMRVGQEKRDEGGELGRLQMECMFNGVELVVGEGEHH